MLHKESYIGVVIHYILYITSILNCKLKFHSFQVYLTLLKIEFRTPLSTTTSVSRECKRCFFLVLSFIY